MNDKLNNNSKITKLLQFNELQNKIFMPNEIFTCLKPLHSKGSSHVAFAYAYYYLISWLYRYAKYGEMEIDVKIIKQLLGYSADNKKINYIIKQNGMLDELGLTSSDTDYPIAWSFNHGWIEFTMLSEMEHDVKELIRANRGMNYKIKVPVKGLWRTMESEEEGILDGTFYDISNTHEMNMDVYVKCMQDSRLGVIGFYLFGYLKYQCDKHGEFNSSLDRIAEDTGIGRSTVDKYLGNLCRSGLINYKENECVKFDGKFKKRANTYLIN